MIANLVSDLIDRFFGRNRYGVTKAAMDGPLRPNSKLDDANALLSNIDADNLVSTGEAVLFTMDKAVWRLGPDCKGDKLHTLPLSATAMAISDRGRLVVALEDGVLLIFNKAEVKRITTAADAGLRCITAVAFYGEDKIVLTNGSIEHTTEQWQVDLMSRNNLGSIWLFDISINRLESLASGLKYPCGLLVIGDTVIVSESWAHRLVSYSLHGKTSKVVLSDLPGYPGRLSKDPNGDIWLCVFAPRSQLIEFVLREDQYRQEMMRTIPKEYWIAPAYRSGDSFEEPLQGGSVKQMGMLKPWAPTRSFGLLVKLNHHLQPDESFHSRADGKWHGITSAALMGEQIVLSSRGGKALIGIEKSTPKSEK